VEEPTSGSTQTGGYASASLVWHGWTPHGKEITQYFEGVMSVRGVPVKVNLHTELTHSRDFLQGPLPEDVKAASVKIAGSPAEELQFTGGFTTVKVGALYVTDGILTAAKGGPSQALSCTSASGRRSVASVGC
jgi:hypothetical protein